MSGGVCKQCGYKAKGKGGAAPPFGKKSAPPAGPNMFTKTVLPPVKPGNGMPFGRKAGKR